MVVLRRFLLCTKWIDCNSSLSSGMDALQNQIPMPSDPEAQRNPSPFWATESSTNAVQTKPLWAGKIKMSSNRRTVVGDLFNRVDTCGIRPPSSFLFFFLPALERGKMEGCTYREIQSVLYCSAVNAKQFTTLLQFVSMRVTVEWIRRVMYDIALE